jgi:hypothetical protein
MASRNVEQKYLLFRSEPNTCVKWRPRCKNRAFINRRSVSSERFLKSWVSICQLILENPARATRLGSFLPTWRSIVPDSSISRSPSRTALGIGCMLNNAPSMSISISLPPGFRHRKNSCTARFLAFWLRCCRTNLAITTSKRFSL